ncbi:CLUMA_CG011546, isoform A [Clunio marinus]|uniref:CLUMA_CG011546, isoform A n=1 Tax=Clunio marinus TaxID=568069 RepID=A0A1J1ID19_9DIPT|nr:CLUMA_CG011546, isoform A [Clunio marinus]
MKKLERLKVIKIKSTRMEHTSYMDDLKSQLETISEALIQSAAHSVLGQCSQEILDSSTEKLVIMSKLIC